MVTVDQDRTRDRRRKAARGGLRLSRRCAAQGAPRRRGIEMQFEGSKASRWARMCRSSVAKQPDKSLWSYLGSIRGWESGANVHSAPARRDISRNNSSGVAAFGRAEMTERRERRVDRVQKPERRDVACGELSGGAGIARSERRALRVEDLDEPAETYDQARVGGDLEERRNEIGVVHKAARAVAKHARNRQRITIGGNAPVKRARFRRPITMRRSRAPASGRGHALRRCSGESRAGGRPMRSSRRCSCALGSPDRL